MRGSPLVRELNLHAKPEEKKCCPKTERTSRVVFKKKTGKTKKEGGCNTVVANMTLGMDVCVSLHLLRTSEENAKGHLGTREVKQPQRSPEKRTEKPIRRDRGLLKEACQRQELPRDKDEEQCQGYRGQEGRKANTVS